MEDAEWLYLSGILAVLIILSGDGYEATHIGMTTESFNRWDLTLEA